MVRELVRAERTINLPNDTQSTGRNNLPQTSPCLAEGWLDSAHVPRGANRLLSLDEIVVELTLIAVGQPDLQRRSRSECHTRHSQGAPLGLSTSGFMWTSPLAKRTQTSAGPARNVVVPGTTTKPSDKSSVG